MGVHRVTTLVLTLLLIGMSLSLAAPAAADDVKPDLEIDRVPSAGDGVGVLAGCSLGEGTTPLANATATAFTIDNAAGSQCHFSFAPIAGNSHTRVQLSWVASGPQDFDLYVRRGAPPTLSLYDCRPYLGGSNETCLVENDGQTVYVMVYRFSGSGSASVTATSLTPPPTCALGSVTTALTSGSALTTSVTGDLGARCQFSFTFPAGTNLARVNVTPSNTSNNVNLYAKYGAAPSSSNPPTGSECSSVLSGISVDSCSMSNNGQTLFFSVYRPTAGTFGATFTIRVDAFSTCSLGSAPIALSNGVDALGSLSWEQRANCLFSFSAGTLGDLGRVNLTPATDNFDVRLRLNGVPTFATTTVSGVSCASSLSGVATDSCSLPIGPSDTIYALVFRPVAGTATRDFSVRGDALNSCSLGLGVHTLTSGVAVAASLLNVAGANCKFAFDPDNAADFASFVLPATTPADFDLYVKKGSMPTTISYDCRPYLGGSSTETCDALIEDTQDYYAMVYRFSSGGAFTLTATATIVPVLENGVPQAGVVGPGAMTYFKAVVPAGSSALAVAIAGDVADAVCSAVDSVAASTCANASAADETVCANVEPSVPGACDNAPAFALARPNADLYVRHRAGLPTASVNDCKVTTPGSLGACAFSNDLAGLVASAAQNYTALRSDAWANCPGLPQCADNRIPAWPGVPAQASIVPFKGAGKYFVAVRGTSGPADFAIVAAYA